MAASGRLLWQQLFDFPSFCLRGRLLPRLCRRHWARAGRPSANGRRLFRLLIWSWFRIFVCLWCFRMFCRRHWANWARAGRPSYATCAANGRRLSRLLIWSWFRILWCFRMFFAARRLGYGNLVCRSSSPTAHGWVAGRPAPAPGAEAGCFLSQKQLRSSGCVLSWRTERGD